MNNRSTIYLETADETRSPAILRTDLTKFDLEQADNLWYPVKFEMESQARRAGIRFFDHMRHSHWTWSDMWTDPPNENYYIGIQVQEEFQGLMILKSDQICNVFTQRGLPLIYVDRIATAPWNNAGLLAEFDQRPRYKKVGTRLMQAAIDISRENGWEGRIGLHSLVQAEDFYRNRCRMLEFSPDSTHEYLRYFEMTPEIASAFLIKED